ncbi:DUF3817 domain-containing protein [Olleya aquimaris]|uniref:DUF3817 domain-containing protein n=1 Tax=Olleya sediminilitoris TaxID=2795739 RepID=A0ABS1WMJ0_9FLAO|nr:MULTISPECIES: DUF3817 domain-containing protein [Olleya]AXO79185.1 DUF3817 domain-containing protein [Olleya aquimaris]MBL7560332.1 DUF3817 domain-containing protein [Olleya sediminilitoris]
MLNTFRIVALLEGLSYLFLMAAAIYKRLPGGDDYYVRLLGMPHGLLFVAYIALAFLIKPEQKWSNKVFGIVLLASILPFGTFYVDKKYLKS